jgi:hypothetical protein
MIARLIADPKLMADASARNLSRAYDFHADSLTPRRSEYYQAVREAVVANRPVGVSGS